MTRNHKFTQSIHWKSSTTSSINWRWYFNRFKSHFKLNPKPLDWNINFKWADCYSSVWISEKKVESFWLQFDDGLSTQHWNRHFEHTQNSRSIDRSFEIFVFCFMVAIDRNAKFENGNLLSRIFNEMKMPRRRQHQCHQSILKMPSRMWRCKEIELKIQMICNLFKMHNLHDILSKMRSDFDVNKQANIATGNFAMDAHCFGVSRVAHVCITDAFGMIKSLVWHVSNGMCVCLCVYIMMKTNLEGAYAFEARKFKLSANEHTHITATY